MDNKAKLELLQPLLKQLLTVQDIKKIGEHLKKTRCISIDINKALKKSQKNKKSQTSLSYHLIQALKSSTESKWLKHFLEAIKQQTKDNSELFEIIQIFFGPKKNESLGWIIKNWNRLKSSKNAWEGVEFMIQKSDNADEDQWLTVAHIVATAEADSSTMKLLIPQLMKNLDMEYGKKNLTTNTKKARSEHMMYLKGMLSAMLSPEQCINIAEKLHQQKCIKKDQLAKVVDCQRNRHCMQDMHERLLISLQKNFKAECITIFISAIKEEGLVQVANVVEVFTNTPNPVLSWLLLRWSKLNDISSTVVHFAVESITTQQEIEQSGRYWLCHIISKVTETKHDAVNKFMQALCFRWGEMAISPKEQTTYRPVLFDKQTSKQLSCDQQISTEDYSAEEEESRTVSKVTSAEFTGTAEPLPSNTPDVIISIHEDDDDMKPVEDYEESQETPRKNTIEHGSFSHRDNSLSKAGVKFVNETKAKSERKKETNGKSNKRHQHEEHTYDDGKMGRKTKQLKMAPNDKQDESCVENTNDMIKTRSSTEKKEAASLVTDSSQPGVSKSSPIGLDSVKADVTEMYRGKSKSQKEIQFKNEREDHAIDNKNLGRTTNHPNKESLKLDQTSVEKLINAVKTRSSAKKEVAASLDTSPKSEICLEFKLAVDKNFTLPDKSKFYVYIDNPRKHIQLQPEGNNRQKIFYATINVQQARSNFCYKYFFFTEKFDSKTWENLPRGEKYVNRKLVLSEERKRSKHVILFDVASFDDSDMLVSTFCSMYTRNILHYLPATNLMKLGECLPNQLSLNAFIHRLNEWWQCALSGVKFSGCSLKADIKASCRYFLEEHIKSSYCHDSLKNAVDICRRTLAYVALATIITDVAEVKPEARWNLCNGLSLCGATEESIKLLCEEIGSLDRTTKPKVLSALHDVLEYNKERIRSIWLIPIYCLLKHDGKLNMCSWNNFSNEFNLKKLAETTSILPSEFTSMAPAFLSISKALPIMEYIYMPLLRSSSVLELVETGQKNVLSALHPGKFLIKLAENDIDFMPYARSKKLISWMEKYLDDMKFDLQEKKSNPDELLFGYLTDIKVASEVILKKLDFRVRNYQHIQNWLGIVVKIETCIMHLSQVPDKKDTPLVDVSTILCILRNWLDSDHDDVLTHVHIQFWNYLLSVSFLSIEVEEQWKSQLKFVIIDRILAKIRKNNSLVDKFLLLDEMNATKEVESCFSEAIYQYALEASKDNFKLFGKDIGISNFWSSSLNANKLAPILEKLFFKEWNSIKRKDIDGVLHFILNWPFASNFFKLYSKEETRKIFSQSIEVEMALIKQNVHAYELIIKQGAILFHQMQEICVKKLHFIEIISTLLKDIGSSTDPFGDIKSLIELREQELNLLLEIKEEMQYFSSIVQIKEKHDFDLATLHDAVTKNMSEMPWCEIFECREDSNVSSANANVMYFHISDDLRMAMKEMLMCKIKETRLTSEIWFSEVEKAVKQLTDEGKQSQLNQEQAVSIWHVTRRKISALKHELSTGNISLNQINETFGNYDIESPQKLNSQIFATIQAIYSFPDLKTSFVEEELVENEGNLDQESFRKKVPQHNWSSSSTGDDGNDIQEEDVVEELKVTEQKEKLEDFEVDEENYEEVDYLEEEENEETCFEECKEAEIGENDHVIAELGHNVSDLETDASADATTLKHKDLTDDVKFENEEECLQYRVKQICHYLALARHEVAASSFLKLKECLELEGDFSYIEFVQEKENLLQVKPLKSISAKILERSAAIKDVTTSQLDLLKGFVKNSKLIAWLRKSMKDRREVKVLSDLAMISAGETTLEVDRVSCFLSAVMGFAPFIFDLKKTDGLSDAQEALTEVSQTPEHNKMLLNKWHATAQYLEWLKGIADFHGSVEKSSLLRAQEINAHGIYIVGGETTSIPAVVNALKLEIPAKGESESKTMTVDDLHNLQSRLMLIVGEADKGLNDVKVFIEVLAHVENLTSAYVKLKLAGCLLFDNWTVKLRYQSIGEEGQDMKSSIEIRFDKKSQPVFCKEKVIDELKALTSVLETALQKWRNLMTEKRKQYYHLNHFNIQQMTYLCKELARIDEYSGIPDQVHTLLACIKQDVSGEDIFELLREATKVKEKPVVEDEDENEDHILPENTSLTPSEQKKLMARRLIDEEGLSERLAKASVQALGIPLDFDKCFIKSLELEYEDEQVNQLAKQFDDDIGFSANSNEINVIQSVINDRSHLTLQEVIVKILDGQTAGGNSASVAVKTICERYVETTGVTSLSDSISTEHLGKFLTNLSMQINSEDIFNRQFPAPLEKGKPNLIVCSEQDMFSTLLSIYMFSPGQSLPTASEVLLCSETTSKEETELLLRRAIGSGTKTGSKIYCLAFADRLSFKVANATANMIKQLQKDQNGNLDYKLVVLSLCSSAQHFIASLLHENRVDYSNRFPMEKLKEYMAQHLQIHETQNVTPCFSNANTITTSIQVVASDRAGLGKSLHIRRCRSHLPADCHETTIRLLDKQLDEDDIMQCLYSNDANIENRARHFVHFDVTPSVQKGVDKFVFNLFILGAFTNRIGYLWRRQPSHLYFIEYTKPEDEKGASLEQQLLDLLPTVHCKTPLEVLQYYDNSTSPENVLLMDEIEFQSEIFQRPYQYLSRYSKKQNLDNFSYTVAAGTYKECLMTLLHYCGIKEPTWSELRHFASFLSFQLLDCERSSFCDMALVGADSGLSGFKEFVVRFMIRMSQDFATPSLYTDTNTEKSNQTSDIFELHQLRRRWEEDAHPYLFFNEDRMSMSFINFQISRAGDLLDPKENKVIQKKLMSASLYQGLTTQKVILNRDFDRFRRDRKLLTLCRVMGVQANVEEPKKFNDPIDIDDPDPTYELTTDNVLKMLAIHMRFRCGIPVVVMGETGCGKTRMVEFMSKLKAGGKKDIQNMVIVKVHGGITVSIIQDKVREAISLAKKNQEEYNIETMLFLDEANTTEAIYAIKEFVCDRTVHGEAFRHVGLNIVAACNPYRKHDKEALKKLEESGLGFRVKTEDTTEKLGTTPMRHLVYRVIALPPSMKPLVWDFGQLTNKIEKVYIEQMVAKLAVTLSTDSLRNDQFKDLAVDVLSTSQQYMREQREQCSYVSLRDVERCLQSFQWFSNNMHWLNDLIDKEKSSGYSLNKLSSIVRTLLQAIGMCYHVTLDERNGYRQRICKCFTSAGIQLSADGILEELIACQSVFIKNISLEDNIARNEALRENVFMMVMCTEMRIPLFLIGKPGSSKSLAKTIVTDAMQGTNSTSLIFRKLKEVHVISFQCSAVSDAVGIENVFIQCANLQKNRDPKKFVSVVVLDEVGLAEDSPKMPLKVLHPLLEGTGVSLQNVVKPQQLHENVNHRVGFVGISNWALDPAKMNRGILVQRVAPTENDLKLTAQGIFSSDTRKFKEVDRVVDVLTASYLEICENQQQEFFGLRDYYGLLKMIFAVVMKDEVDLDCYVVAIAIKRNFNGGKEDCFPVFLKHLKRVWQEAKNPRISLASMIKNNLKSTGDSENRFLLLLSNQFSAMNLLPIFVDCSQFQVIFGSSFPQDNDYTELCRNINRIKLCMESGCTVVLLNLRDLYESLYDALNQHYVTFAGQHYVDLGLGGHRVKCRVAKEFRLIVIEDKNVVYDEFPIPLINRLEKHVFTTDRILTGDQEQVAERLNGWAKSFSEINIPLHKRRVMKQFTEQDSFVGYAADGVASAVLSLRDVSEDDELYAQAQLKLLNTATVDAVFRLSKSQIRKEVEKFQEAYLFLQTHDNLFTFIKKCFQQTQKMPMLYELTSYSQILSEEDREKLEVGLELCKNSIMLLTLQQFQTQEEYNMKVESFFNAIEGTRLHSDSDHFFVLLIQCPQAEKNTNLIACAKYSIKNLIQAKFVNNEKAKLYRILITFLYTVERQCGAHSNTALCGSYSSDCEFVHIDELRMSADYIGHPSRLWKKQMGEVLEESKQHLQKPVSISLLANAEYMVDPKALVCSSIPGAVIKLKNVNMLDDGGEKRNRVKILHQLCTGIRKTSAPFLKILYQRIVQVVKERDQTLIANTYWYVEEACSHEALHEGGTFAKTLWLRLKKVVTLVLGKIISAIDEDENLDIIFDDDVDGQIGELWLKVFEDGEVCPFNWKEISETSKVFEVQGKNNFKCNFPFSRKITEFFTKHWWNLLDKVHANEATNFFRRIENYKFSRIVVNVSGNNPIPLLEVYARDLVHIRYKSETKNLFELELVAKALVSIFTARQRKKMWSGQNVVAIIFSLFMDCTPYLKQLSILAALLPEIINQENINDWITKQNSCCEFVVHIMVYDVVLQHLKAEIDSLSDPHCYRSWRERVQKLINIEVDGLESSEMPLLQNPCIAIKSTRKSIAFVKLFLNMLIPDGLSDGLFQQYLRILAVSAKRLSLGATIQGMGNVRFLNIVIKQLRGCTREVYLKHLVSWTGDLKCQLCKKKVVKPVVLPCKHFFCLECIKLQAAASIATCPKCLQAYPEDFQLVPAKLSTQQLQDMEGFKANCNSFFLEYLSNLCFPAPDVIPSNTPFSEQVSEVLQDLVICKNYTRAMTPLDLDMDTFDNAPTIRSFILQLLLRYDPHQTRSALESHFQKAGHVLKSKLELMMIYIRCIEDSLYNRASAFHPIEAGLSKFSSQLTEEIDTTLEELNLTQVETLNLVAKMRFVMKLSTKTVYDQCMDNENESNVVDENCFMKDLRKLLDNHELTIAKQYFVKMFCRRYGLSAFNQLLQVEKFAYMIPHQLISEDIDQVNVLANSLCALGEEYGASQRILSAVETDNSIPEAAQKLCDLAERSQDATVQVLQGVVTWLNLAQNLKTKTFRKELSAKLIEQLCECESINTDLIEHYKAVLQKEIILPKMPTMSHYMLDVIEQVIVIVGATVFSNPESIFKDLIDLFNNPDNIINAFLPTMPQSSYFEVKECMSTLIGAYGVAPKLYFCPNKHPYFIEDCTRPVPVNAVCNDCKEPIGGSAYNKLIEGNTSGELSENTQVGYLLGRAGDRPTSATPERNCSRLSVCIMRMFLHATLFCASRCGHDVSSALSMENSELSEEFLFQHLHKDLLQLCDCLGKSVDDVLLLLHQVMKDMRMKVNVKHQLDANLHSLDGRKIWETEFHNCFLVSVFMQIDERIEEARTICLNSYKQNTLQRLVYEMPDDTDISDEISDELVQWNSPSLWKHQTHIAVEHLRQRLEGNVVNKSDSGMLLKMILNETDLAVIRHLPTILTLQNSLIQRFHRKVDMIDVDNMTIQEYCDKELESNNIAVDQFQLYLEVWNKVKGNLPILKVFNTPKHSSNEEMNLNSPISMCIPSKAGRGSCALALTEYIAEKQNNLLNTCRELMKPQPTFSDIAVPELKSSDLICIDTDRNLMPLILANSQYEVTSSETGTYHQIVYRIAALEKQVLEKFILNRKSIKKETLPSMKYLQDMGIEEECIEMQKNVTQSQLPIKIAQKISALMDSARLPDICEGVRTLTLVISYLAKMSSAPDRLLLNYITEDLLLPNEEASMIPRSAQLRHTLALFERLSCQRSVRFVANGQDPYTNIKHGNQEEIKDDMQIKNFFDVTNVAQLQLELNSLILLKQSLPSHSSLRDNLFAFLEEKYSNDDEINWSSNLPNHLQLKHAAHMFRLSVWMNN